MAYSLLRDDGATYHLMDDAGTVLRVAKGGLSEAGRARILALPKAQRFADGGEVLNLTGNPELDALLTQTPPAAPSAQAPAPLPPELTPYITGVPEIDSAPPLPQQPQEPMPWYGYFGAAGSGGAGGYAGASPSLPAAAPPEQPPAAPPQPPAPPGMEAWNAALAQNGQPQAQSVGYTAASLPPNPMAGMGGRLSQIEQEGQAAANQQAQAEIQKGQTLANIQSGYQDSLQKQQAIRQKAWDDTTKEYQSAVEDYKNQHIDPNRVWAGKGAGQKMSALIGIVLGGMGQGVTGGPNQALEVVQREIDRDIDAQKAEIGKKQNLISMLYQKFGNIDAADAAARMYLGASIQSRVEEAAARAATPEALAKAKLFMAQMHQGLLGPAMQLAQFNYQMQFTRMMVQQAQSGGLPAQYIRTDVTPPPLESPDMAGIAKQQRELQERTIPGPQGKLLLARDPQAASKARERLAGATGFEETLRQMEALARDGAKLPGGTAKATYDRLRKTASTEFARMVMGGQPGENEIKMGEDVLPSTWETFYRSPQNAFQPALQTLGSQRAAIWNTYAGTPIVRHGG